jgi:hypothetical protein
MAERASVFQGVQLGVEATYGVGVAANRKLTGSNIEMGPRVELETFRALGMKFSSVAALNKEWAEGTLSGPITYTELVYWLSSVMRTSTPTGGTLARTWVFDMAEDAADAVKSFTIEQGSAERAHEMSGALLTGLTLEFSRDGCEMSGTIMATALEDGITLTPAPTTVALVPVMASQVIVKLADTAAGLTAAPPLARALTASYSVTDRFAPVWALNGSNSFPATVETAPTAEVTLQVEADAEGMGLLEDMREGATKFMRIEATGSIIELAVAYKLQIDAAFVVSDVTPFSDEDGVFAVEYTGTIVYDPTWTRATQVTVINQLTTL